MAGFSNFGIVRGASPELDRAQDGISRALNPLLQAVANTPIMGAAAPAWIKPALLNGFSQWPAPFAVIAYHKDALGYVHCKGKAKHVAGALAGVVAWVLPKGYRPSEVRCFAVEGGAVFQSIHVDSAGNVSNAYAVAAGSSIDFEFSFLAEG